MRILDYRREKHGIPAVVDSIEYDPNRTARVALLNYADGEKRYILAPVELKVGDSLMSGPNAEIRAGNCLPISNIPVGTLIITLSSSPGGRPNCPCSGGAAQLLGKEGDFAQVRLPSGEVRLVRQVCYATVGTIGNVDHSNVKLGKAGRKRHKGIRPQSAARLCRRVITRTAAAKDGSQSACQGRRARGESPRWDTRLAATRRAISTSSDGAANRSNTR